MRECTTKTYYNFFWVLIIQMLLKIEDMPVDRAVSFNRQLVFSCVLNWGMRDFIGCKICSGV